jgi:lysozyme
MPRSARYKKNKNTRTGLSVKAKKQLRTGLLLVLALLLIGLFAWLYTEWRYYQRAIKARFPEFGISMPAHHTIHGIDVSRYQQYISWPDVSAMEVLGIKLGFAFIKATEGTGYTDPRFARNWQHSKKNKLARGAYHFFVPTASGLAQARHFLSEVTWQAGDLPPVLDIELAGNIAPAQLRKEALSWLRAVEQACGVRPILYTNVGFYQRYLGSAFDSYPLWIAHYYRPQQPNINRGWTFWQHSDAGRVNGIEGPVDFNVFNGDSTAFRRILIP